MSFLGHPAPSPLRHGRNFPFFSSCELWLQLLRSDQRSTSRTRHIYEDIYCL